MGKINELINELQSEIEEETGHKPAIEISIYHLESFKEANNIVNKFNTEIGGKKKIWSHNGTKGIRNTLGDIFEGVEIATYFEEGK